MNLTELNKVRNYPLHKELGIHQIEAEAGKARIELLVTEKILNPGHTFHGGILYFVCDVAAFSASLTLVEEGHYGVTNNISIQVMRPARLDDLLLFKAEVIKMGRRLIFIETTVTCEGKVIAKATVTKTMI